MSATEPTEDGPEVVAGEYVLGVLDALERAAAVRRIEADPAFAREVETWEARLIPLIAEVAAIEPPERVWPSIARRLGGTVTPLRSRTGVWDSVTTWRALTAASMALAAASLALVVLRPAPPVVVVRQLPAPATPGPVAVARLEAPKGAPGGASYVASFDGTRRQLIITPTGKPQPGGKSAQLWLMPDKEKPVALGVFMGEAPLVVSAPAGVTSTSLLGVSLEPQGGSPTGQPTGPVIAVGKLMAL